MRTPLLPFRVLTEWARFTSASDGGPVQPASRPLLRDRLKLIIGRAEVLEAIFLASPALHSEVLKWLASDKSDADIEQAMTRYVQRMASRPTPFGIFAGCSFGRLGQSTDLLLPAAEEYRRSARLDNDYLYSFAATLDRDPRVREQVSYRQNSSLYKLAGRWRYVERTLVDARRKDKLVELEDDPVLSAVIDRCKRPTTRSSIVDEVLSKADGYDIERPEAEQYVDQLIDAQVILSDLTPVVTGHDPLDDLISQFGRWSALSSARQTLRAVSRAIADLNETELGTNLQHYAEIERIVRATGPTPDRAKLFQVDLRKPASGSQLSRTTLDDLCAVVHALHSMAPPPGDDALKRFKEAFLARYDQREVPLFEALDEESGVGFAASAAPTAEHAPLLQGLRFPAAGVPVSLSWTGRERFLISKLEPVLRGERSTLVLTDEDVAALEQPRRLALPDALHVMVSVGNYSTDDANCLTVIRAIGGPSGANLMGRFCHSDKELTDGVRAHLQKEEEGNPAALFAEVVHLPEGRLGNILARPVLRKHEIVFLGRSGVTEDCQIAVSDLLVSVRDDRVVLRSASRGVEVLPRMTNAHNYRNGLGIYRFLCTLQTQGVTPILMWQWGPLEAFSFLPRIVYRRCVLARARWRAERKSDPDIWNGDMADRISAIRQWQSKTSAPRFCLLVEGDNELLVDFDNDLSLETLLQEVVRRNEVTLTEMCPGPSELIAYGPEGKFVHEIVIPFTKNQQTVLRPPTFSGPVVRPRSFPPGSQWTYLKFYGGTASIDTLLTLELKPFLTDLTEAGHLDRWFFVRYSDPNWHVRLRLQLREHARDGFLGRIEALSRRALRDGRLWRVQLDTYERETERYGGDVGVELAEELFWHDSQAALRILSGLPGDAGMTGRWQMCLLSWHQTLVDFGLTTEEKLQFVRAGAASTGRLLGANKSLYRTVGDKYRVERAAIGQLFDERPISPHALADEIQALRDRRQSTLDVVAKIRAMVLAGESDTPLLSLVGSYLHMNANRLLRSSHREQEFVLFDFLERHYESLLARARGRGAKTAQ